MYYAILGVSSSDEQAEGLIFEDIKEAKAALKEHKGSRMKIFQSKEKAAESIKSPNVCDLSESLEKLTLESASTEGFPSVKPGQLNQLRRKIEAGECDAVEELVWTNPRYLVTVCDSAVYLMAGPKYNACHLAARSNRANVMALLLDTISNLNFMKKLYPDEELSSIQDRVNHLLDSYLNTPDPKQGNTPLHFACKLGHYRVVRVLLTFEGCDLTLKDCLGQTAEESTCTKMVPVGGDDDEKPQEEQNAEIEATKRKIKKMFKGQLHLPHQRDRLKKRLLLEKRRSRAGADFDSDISFSDDSFMSN